MEPQQVLSHAFDASFKSVSIKIVTDTFSPYEKTMISDQSPQYNVEPILDQNLTINSFNMNINSHQPNNSEIFRFEIPGFKIIIIPVPSPIENLNVQDDLNNISSNIIINNPQTEFNESFSNDNNFSG